MTEPTLTSLLAECQDGKVAGLKGFFEAVARVTDLTELDNWSAYASSDRWLQCASRFHELATGETCLQDYSEKLRARLSEVVEAKRLLAQLDSLDTSLSVDDRARSLFEKWEYRISESTRAGLRDSNPSLANFTDLCRLLMGRPEELGESVVTAPVVCGTEGLLISIRLVSVPGPGEEVFLDPRQAHLRELTQTFREAMQTAYSVAKQAFTAAGNRWPIGSVRMSVSPYCPSHRHEKSDDYLREQNLLRVRGLEGPSAAGAIACALLAIANTTRTDPGTAVSIGLEEDNLECHRVGGIDAKLKDRKLRRLVVAQEQENVDDQLWQDRGVTVLRVADINDAARLVQQLPKLLGYYADGLEKRLDKEVIPGKGSKLSSVLVDSRVMKRYVREVRIEGANDDSLHGKPQETVEIVVDGNVKWKHEWNACIRAVIHGEPGSGKSVLTAHMAFDLIRDLRASLGVGPVRRAPLPVHIDLNTLDGLSEPVVELLWKQVESDTKEGSPSSLSGDEKKCLKDYFFGRFEPDGNPGDVYVIFDALDQLMGDQGKLVKAAAELADKRSVRVYITCRTADLQFIGQSGFTDFEKYEMAEWTIDEQLEFIDKYEEANG